MKPAVDAVEIFTPVYEGKPARLKNWRGARERGDRPQDPRAEDAANLTQTQLAGYRYHGNQSSAASRTRLRRSLSAVLRRIAGALNQRVEIRFVPIRRSA